MSGTFEFWRVRVVEHAPESRLYPVTPGVFVAHEWGTNRHNARILVLGEGGYVKPCVLPQ